MKSSIVSFFSGLIICVYVAVIGFFSFFLVIERNNGNDVALSDFQKMVQFTQEAGRTHGVLSPGQLTALKHHIDSNHRIKAVLVENSGLICFAHPTDSAYFQHDEMLRPSLKVSSPMAKTFSTRISSRITDDTKFTAVISVIDVASVLPKLKLVLTIFIATTILCFCMIMYCGGNVPETEIEGKAAEKDVARERDGENHRKKKDFISKRFRRGSGGIRMACYNNIGTGIVDSLANSVKEVASAKPQGDVVMVKEAVPANPRDGIVMVKEAVPAPTPTATVAVKEAIPVNTVDIPAESKETPVESKEIPAEEKKEASSDVTSTENVKSDDEKTAENDLPEFSEAVSIAVTPPVVQPEKTPESYVEDYLNSELRKLVAKDQNLVLLRISVNGLDNSSEEGQRIAKLIAGKYSRDNYIFDYDYNGYAVALQNMELEQAISGCEELYSFMDDELGKMGIPGKISMGLSARSLRNVTGGRLLSEACAALEKAEMSDENPIVAFRANDAKYARYVDESYKVQETT